MDKVKVLIVDDHPIARLSLRIMLEKENYNIVDEADNGFDAVHLAMKLKPDLIVLDIGMPEMSGLNVMKRLRDAMLLTKILIFSTQNPQHFAARCMQAGASGYVCKESDVVEVIAAAKAVMNGYTHFPQVTFNDSCIASNRQEETDLISQLKVRELVIFQHLADGKTNKEIGELLSISNKTVSTYKVSLMQKLNVQSLANLIDFVQRNSLAIS